jgi:hypothetical protein
MLPDRDSRLTKTLLLVFFVVVIVYAYFEARGILFGPHITIDAYPATTSDPYVLIRGRTDHSSSLSIEDHVIPVTQDGAFTEPYVLSLGLNNITLEARDKYGHTTASTLRIVYIPSATSSVWGLLHSSNSASTTATSTLREDATSTSLHNSSSTSPLAPPL